MNYVIIGNSAAAAGCVDGIRSVDKQGKITIVSKEKYHIYSRPLISYLLCGKTSDMNYRPADFYKKNKCKLLKGKTAVKFNTADKQVLLNDGTALPYDKLLTATGSDPFIPPMEGLDKVKHRHTFMSLDDAKALEKDINPNSRVLIVGAGLIGLKCAEGIRDRVKSIAVVDLADRILPSILNAEAAALVQAHIEAHGVQFYLSASVASFAPHTATLTTGEKLPFDVLVTAVGVRPSTALVADAGGKVERGIVTDLRGATSLPDVYAAGDCAQSHDITTGQDKVLALLPNAYLQGRCAGINMAGGDAVFDTAMPMNAIGFFGLHMITAGSYDGEEWVEKTDGSYKKLVTKDGLLKGYILIGEVARAGIYTSLIRNQTPLDTIDFPLIREKPQLIAFSRAQRNHMLGGAPLEA